MTYLTKSKQEWPIVRMYTDEDGRQIAIIKRSMDYMIAIAYDYCTGTWSQGWYDFYTEDAAIVALNNHYKVRLEYKC